MAHFHSAKKHIQLVTWHDRGKDGSLQNRRASVAAVHYLAAIAVVLGLAVTLLPPFPLLARGRRAVVSCAVISCGATLDDISLTHQQLAQRRVRGTFC